MNRRLRIGLVSALCGTLALASGPASAGPEGGAVVAGDATITQSGAQTLVTQTTPRVAIDWTTFNVDAGELVRFDQPSATAAALNRIADTQPSRILGAIEANGRVFLVNPSGIIFGQGARVNVGSLVASSLSIDPERFMQGDYSFAAETGEGGLVVNRGLLQAATGGSVTLLGGAVANEGLIIADYGRVDLGAGRAAVLDFDGDGLVGFKVTEDVLENAAGVEAAAANRGEIRADGGQVLVTARAARDVFSQVVNNEGIIRAARVDRTGGVVRLVGAGGTTVNAGTIDVDGATDADTGGRVDVLGDRVALTDTARIEASGPAGGGTVRIGGDFHGAGADAPNAEATDVAAGATIHADATASGDGGRVAVWSDGVTRYAGEISARGGDAGGDGGFVEVSGKGSLVYAGQVDARAPAGATGTLLLDPTDIHVVDPATLPNTTDRNLVDEFGDADQNGSETAIQASSINTALADVVLQATQDIFFDTAVSIAADGIGLTAQAGRNINVTSTITTTNGAVQLEADSPDAPGTGGDGSGTLTVSAPITVGNADVTLIGADFDITAAVNAGAGDVNLSLSRADILTLANTGQLEEAELNQIHSTGTLTVGRATTAGATTVTPAQIDLGQSLTLATTVGSAVALVTTGNFNFSNNVDLITSDRPLAITAFSMVMPNNSSVDAGLGSLTLIAAGNTDIQAGGADAPGIFSLTDAEMANLSASDLFLQTGGDLTVDGFTGPGITGTTNLTGNTVQFSGGASSFNALVVTANDVALTSTVDTGAGSATFIDSDGSGIHLGGAGIVGDLNLSGTELQAISTTDLLLQTAGDITVEGITAGNSDNVAGTLTLASGGGTAFSTTASTFNTLSVQADNGVTVDVGLTTDTGDLALEGDANDAADGSDGVSFAAGVTVTSAGAMTLNGTNGGVTGDGDLTLNAANGVTANDALGTIGDLTVDADTDAGDTGGSFIVADGLSTGGALSVTADDVQLTGTVNTGASATFVDSDGTGIHLGGTDLINGLTLDGGELQNLTATGLTLQTAGDVTVNGISADNSNNIAGTTTLTGNTVSFVTAASTFNTLAVNAADGVTVGANLTTDTGGITVNADTDAPDDDGTFAVNAAVDTGGGDLSVTANEVELTSTVDTGVGSATFIDSDGTGIGLGATAAVTNGLNLTGAELQAISTTDLTLQTAGDITVEGITAGQSNNVAGTLTLASGGGTAFSTTASTFNALSVQADDGVTVDVGLTTDTGDLALEGDANDAADGSDGVSFAAGLTVTSAGAMTLNGTNGGVTGDGALTLNAADGVTANDALGTTGTLTVNADTDAGGGGSFIVANGLSTSGSALSVTADDVQLAGTVNTVGALATFVDSDGTGIHLGGTAVAGDLSLSGTELQAISATGLTLQTDGGITVNGISAANSNNIAGATTLTGNTVSFVTAASTFNTLAVNAADGVTVGANLNTDIGGITVNADTDADDNNGTFAVSAPVSTGGSGLLVTANDMDLTSTVNTVGALAIFVDSDGSGIGLGGTPVTDGLNLTGAELQNVSATGLTLQTTGGMTVSGISAANSQNVAGTTTLDAGGTVTVSGGSVFNTLSAQANNGIAVSAALVTDTGALALDGDADNAGGGALTLASGAALSGATGVSLDATGGGVLLTGTASVTSGGGAIQVNDAVNGGFALTLNAATTVGLGDLGGTTPLASLTATGSTINLGGDIATAAGAGNDVTFNGDVRLGSTVMVSTGGATTFGGALDATGDGVEGLTLQVGSGTAQLGSVGQSTRLGALSVSGAGGASLGDNITAASVDMSGLTGTTTLGADLAVDTSTGSGNLFLNGGPISGANRTLTLDAGGGAMRLGDVGASGAELAGLNLTAGTLQLSGDVYTKGGLDFSGITTISVASGASALLATNSDSGTVALAGTALEGPGTLQIQAGGGTVALGDVGQSTRLGALAVTTTGTTTLGGDISTGGAGGVDLSGAAQVNLGTDVTIDTTVGSGAVDLSGGAVDGAQILVVQAGSGAVTLGNMGQNTALASLTVGGGPVTEAATDRVTASGDVSITGGQTTLNGVVESTGGALAASSTAGTLRVGQLRSAGAMTLGASVDVLGDGRDRLDPRGANLIADSLVVNALSGSVGNLGAFMVLDLANSGTLNTKASYVEVIHGNVTSTGLVFEKGFIKGDAGRGQTAVTSAARTLDPSLFNTEFNLFAVEEGGILPPPDQREE